jgi:outer membrane protein OmpA-like peptidoglycan-associated protein
VIGHTSATGLAPINDRLSGLRADYIKDRLEGEERVLRGRLVSTGKGSREMIVGTGKDDASDALDRRVEFKTVKCSVTG